METAKGDQNISDKGVQCILVNTVADNWVSEEETFLIPTEVETIKICYKSQVDSTSVGRLRPSKILVANLESEPCSDVGNIRNLLRIIKLNSLNINIV